MLALLRFFMAKSHIEGIWGIISVSCAKFEVAKISTGGRQVDRKRAS